MRWRFVDRIDAFEPWVSASGAKAISLEECNLLKPFGRKGEFPESLILESCVHLLRWLVVKSSEFESACVLDGVADFAFRESVGMGEVLGLSATICRRDGATVESRCVVSCSGGQVAWGTLTVRLVPLSESFDAVALRGMWDELYG